MTSDRFSSPLEPYAARAVISTRVASSAQAWPWIGLLALWIVVTAYNLFKPFHIDDVAHLEIAKWIASHPLHPMSGTLNWSGSDELIAKTNQPHLYFYLIAGWGALFGYSEPALHMMQAIFSLAAILLMYRLARRLVPDVALWVTALVILGPAFIVEQNLMVDVPLLAVWLGFFNVVILESDSPSQTRRMTLAAILCAIAVLIKYSSLVLLPVLCFVVVFERRWRLLWVLLIPVAALLAWSAFNVWDYGHVHILDRDAHTPGDRWRPLRNVFAWMVGLGALSPLGVLFATAMLRLTARAERLAYVLLAGLFSILILASAGHVLSDRISDKLLWVGFVVNGVLIGIGIGIGVGVEMSRLHKWRWTAVPIPPKDAAVVYLVLWIAATTLFYIMFAPFMAPRHILLVLPAVTLFLAHQRWTDKRDARVFALGVTAVISLGLCVADWNFASFYKAEAATLASELPATGRRWITGHWGWQWYAEAVGFQELDPRSSPLAVGDTIVMTKDVDLEEAKIPASLTPLRTIEENNQGVNPFCTGRVSSFYLFRYWSTPWTLSRHCGGHVDIYEVTSLAPPK